MLAFRSSRPVHFPSAAARAAVLGDFEEQRPEASQFRHVLRKRSLILLVVAVGCFDGMMIAWSSLFQTMFGPLGLSEDAVGWMGFGNGCAANIAGIGAGAMIDTCFRRRLKVGIIISGLGSLCCIAWFTMSTGAAHSVMPHSVWSLTFVLVLAGAFQGALEPLSYELAAELAYPAKESTSAGAMVFVLNGMAGLVIGLNTALDAASMSCIVNVATVAVLLCIFLGVKEEYRRPQDRTANAATSLQ